MITCIYFFFNDTATTEIYTLSLHDALPILGYILVGEEFIDSENLRAALATQMQQTVFRLFRWRDGEYNFEPKNSVEYDKDNVIPMATESILMRSEEHTSELQSH